MHTKNLHRLSFWQKKKRSLIKRFFPKFINTSDSFILQHLPEEIDSEKIDIKKFRKIWMEQEHPQPLDLVRLLFLISNAKDLTNVPGAIAEVGVYKGYTAKILTELFPDRRFYLFDTFEGFEKSDFTLEKVKKHSSNFFDDTSLSLVQNYLGSSPNHRYCKGYFPSTTSMVEKGETFSLVHLDADLYAPIKSGLEYFYPKMSPGGMLIVHDYSSNAWPGVIQAVDEFLVDKPEGLIRIPDKSGTVVIKKVAQ